MMRAIIVQDSRFNYPKEIIAIIAIIVIVVLNYDLVVVVRFKTAD